MLRVHTHTHTSHTHTYCSVASCRRSCLSVAYFWPALFGVPPNPWTCFVGCENVTKCSLVLKYLTLSIKISAQETREPAQPGRQMKELPSGQMLLKIARLRRGWLGLCCMCLYLQWQTGRKELPLTHCWLIFLDSQIFRYGQQFWKSDPRTSTRVTQKLWTSIDAVALKEWNLVAKFRVS